MTIYSKIIFYIFLLIYPLGVLISKDVNILGSKITIVPIDFVVFLALPILWIKERKYFKYFINLVSPIVFVSLISYAIYYELNRNVTIVVTGLMYLTRMLTYFAFPFFIFTQFQKKYEKIFIYKSLIFLTLVVSIIGIFQYLYLPDLRSLKFIGWDDHLYRLVSTFLDPTFTGLIITFGLLISINHLFNKDNNSVKSTLIVIGILLFSLFLTYSRSSYLAFLISSIYLIYNLAPKLRYLVIFIPLLFISVLPFLPKKEGYGVKLDRTHSIIAKIYDSQMGLKIFFDYPLFGVGYNNICSEKLKYADIENQINSCFGLDNLILLLLTTFGTVGFLLFVKTIINYYEVIDTNSSYFYVFMSLVIALSIHSMFSNSFFYPWVISYLAIICGLCLKKLGVVVGR